MRPLSAALAVLSSLIVASAVAPAFAATPEEVRAAIPKLEAYIERLIADDAVPGLSLAIVFGDEVYLNGFGVREEGRPETVDADTVFQIASLSKPLSSTIVAALVGEGFLDWKTRISEIDPSFQLLEAYPTAWVTVADLFAHHSGLPGNAGNELESLGFSRDDILARLRLVEPLNSFRGGYSYSNFGLTAGAVAAAKAAGLGWDEAAEKMLFEPLGMTSSSMRHDVFLTRDNRAVLHVPYEGKWQPLAQRQPDAQAPAGGVSSSARDLAKWLRLQLGDGEYEGRQLVDRAALEATHTPVTAQGMHPISGEPSFYALGWGVRYGPHGVTWVHAGAFSTGARSLAQIYPEAGFGIVVLSNAFPTGAPEAVADTFADLVFEGTAQDDLLARWNGLYEGMFGPAVAAAQATYGTPPSPKTPALPASAYVGTFANDYFGEADIVEEEGGLVLKIGPDQARSFPLEHFDRDLFVYYPYDETPDAPYPISFRIGPDGKAAAIEIEDLDEVGHGVLDRKPD